MVFLKNLFLGTIDDGVSTMCLNCSFQCLNCNNTVNNCLSCRGNRGLGLNALSVPICSC